MTLKLLRSDVREANDESFINFVKNGYTLIPQFLALLKRRKDGKERGLVSPYNSFNGIVPGFYGGDLVVVAGRPSMGKTAFAGSLALSFASQGEAVLLFSLEMSASQILGRIIAGLSGVAPHKLQSGDITDEEMGVVEEARQQHAEALKNLFVVDEASLSADNMASLAIDFYERLGRKPGPIFIDYLQLMSTSGGSEHREKDVAACSAAAKRLARKLDTPVFLLSQLNRSVELRSSKRPMLSDLRESGAIEQDADIVVFLFREEYYGGHDAVEGATELIVAKHRNGPTGTANVWFDKERVMFNNGEA